MRSGKLQGEDGSAPESHPQAPRKPHVDEYPWWGGMPQAVTVFVEDAGQCSSNARGPPTHLSLYREDIRGLVARIPQKALAVFDEIPLVNSASKKLGSSSWGKVSVEI